MSELPYKSKESGKDIAKSKGWLAKTPDSLNYVEKQKHIEAEKKRKDRDEKLTVVFDQMNQTINQTYYCPNSSCQMTVQIGQNFCTNCGIRLMW